MTLELEKGAVLFGSPNADHYDSNYLLYPYSTDTRSWALINAYSSDENGMLENIRITGDGIIDGNGYMAKAVILKEMVTLFSISPARTEIPKIITIAFLNGYPEVLQSFTTLLLKVLWAFWLQMQL